ncbi:hypothetical protein FZC74_15900 [Sutcliffiella horikoshii]|uniref:Uncharacterized protein n=1 Tax=Sutcliffiella horikoshii TaxID=79883 RepID=A0AA95B4Y8_9BACI|nr:hypothetical protein [Sutcliffiella horikoshii]TYS57517.1 hypothetical protein FZC74_15900 [Sutcliffiella horikoshii]
MRISSILRILLLLVFLINLIGCNSDINVSSDITIDGEIIDYIGFSGIPIEEIDTNNPPEIYKDLERMVVKPNEIININYEDIPKKVYLSYWKDEVPQEENVVLSNYELSTPESDGVYVYKIATKWNSRVAKNYLFVVEVKDED